MVNCNISDLRRYDHADAIRYPAAWGRGNTENLEMRQNMAVEQNKVTILGARGSVPVSGGQYAIYGGATACVLLEAEGEVILLDAGSGILNVPQHIWQEHDKIYIFLSHFHLDHLLGLMMSPVLFDKNKEITFYTADKKENIPRALQALMKEPLWPIGPEAFHAKIGYHEIGSRQHQLPDSTVTVQAEEFGHPGGVFAYRFAWAGKSMVYATDCELDREGMMRMQGFARDTDLLILDAQYTREEYEERKGFGHTYIEVSASVAAGSNARTGLLFHHAPEHTDEQMAGFEQELQKEHPQVRFAREGEMIQL